jgi:hypothetical protein
MTLAFLVKSEHFLVFSIDLLLLFCNIFLCVY